MRRLVTKLVAVTAIVAGLVAGTSLPADASSVAQRPGTTGTRTPDHAGSDWWF